MSWWRRSSSWWCCSARDRNCWSLCSRKFFTSCASAALIRRPPFLERPVIRSLHENYHTIAARASKKVSSAAKKSAARVVAPQDERVFHRVRIVVAPRACNVEAKPFVQAPRACIPRSHFERRAPGAQPPRLGEHVMHQRRAVPEPAILRPERDVVDVNLVEHEPECAKACNGALRGAHDVDVADPAVLQLPPVHLPRPWARERFALHLEDAVEVALAVELIDPVRGNDVHFTCGADPCGPWSRASSASDRRTSKGRIACGVGR